MRVWIQGIAIVVAAWGAVGNGQVPSDPEAAELYRRAEEREAAGGTESAAGMYQQVAKRYPESAVAPKAQLKAAQMKEGARDLSGAFDAYTVYLTKFPQGADFEAAVEAQFNIAKLFLEGEKTKLLGLKAFPSMKRAQEMFEAILKNAPFSPLAARAQFFAAQALEKQGAIMEALVAYEACATRYPGDPVAGDALYQVGYLNMNQVKSGLNDPGIARKAREAFEDFLARYPESEKVPQAKENLAALGGAQTRGTLEVAKFYEKTKSYKAAVIYYNEVIRESPGSKEAEEAKTRIDELVSVVGEDALRPGPERTETGARAQARRKFQAQVDTASRPDFNGPPVKVREEAPPARPRPRVDGGGTVSPSEVPAVEPGLPQP
jgi:outer membrane protein assembly factor BamD